MKLGQHLIVSGVIDYAQLNAALERCGQTGERVGAALIALGHATYDQITGALAKQLGVPATKERQLGSVVAKADQLPAEIARAVGAMTVGVGRDRELIVAFADPLDADAVAKVEQATGRIVTATVASTGRLGAAIARTYPADDAAAPTPEPAPPAPASRSIGLPAAGDIAAAAAAAANELASRPRRSSDAMSVAARSKSRSEPGPMSAGVESIGSPIEAPPALDPAAARAKNTSPPAFPMGTLDLEPATLPTDFPRATPVDSLELLPPPPPAPVPISTSSTTPAAEPIAGRRPIRAATEPEFAPGMPAPAAGVVEAAPAELAVARTKSGPAELAVARTRSGSVGSGPLRKPNVPGGTSVPSRLTSGTVAVVIRYAIGVAIMAASGILTYRHCAGQDSWAVETSYRSEQLKATMQLPAGGGWRGHKKLRESRTEGANWMRMEGFYRGGDYTDPTEGLMVLRVHTPGALPVEVDLDEFQRKVAQLGRQVISASPVAVPDLQCALETRVRSEPAGTCRGTGTYGTQAIEVYILLWQDTVDDLMAVIYVAKTSTTDRLDDVKTFISGIVVE